MGACQQACIASAILINAPRASFLQVWQVYASKVGKDPNQLKFFFDGTRVLDDRTPSDLGLEEGDSIDAMMEQLVRVLQLLSSHT